MFWSDEVAERYSRHLLLKEIGVSGQERLLQGRVVIVGVGGLGSAAALYLAAAGVSTLGLADGDVVALSNLQRQIIHSTPEIGNLKVDAAKRSINRLNAGVTVKTYPYHVTEANIDELITAYDFVIDGSDNFHTKFLINDACLRRNKTFSHAGVARFTGQTLTVTPRCSPCCRCIFEDSYDDAQPDCNARGVLGVLPGIIGLIQATEAIKYLANVGKLLTGRLLICDLLEMRFREVKVDVDCRH